MSASFEWSSHRLVLDCQGSEMGIGRQIAAATRPLEEIE